VETVVREIADAAGSFGGGVRRRADGDAAPDIVFSIEDGDGRKRSSCRGATA
jgi:hypothetical protein